MQIRIDMHVHSNHSVDSKTSMDDMCRAAMAKGFSHICFTDHVDMNPRDDGYNFYCYERYARDINQVREKYSSRLTILKGVEFGEPHRYPRDFEKILKNGYDFVLGSIHWLGEYWAGEKTFQEKYDIRQIYEMHYEEILHAVQFGGFDSLAHMDFPKRYLPSQYQPVADMDAILKEIVKRDIALELNTSPLRKGLPEICPNDAILDLYMKNGGSKVTVGSDAHHRDEIGGDFVFVERILDNRRFQNLTFINRKGKELFPSSCACKTNSLEHAIVS